MRVPRCLTSAILFLLACSLPLPAMASGSTGLERAKANVCLSCHQIDKKRVGPSFEAIGERYLPVQGAIDYLAIVIKDGGRGRWGAVPMPAQPQVSHADALVIAQWILDLAAKKQLGSGS